MSDHNDAVLLFFALPRAKELLADKGCDSDWFRTAQTERGTTPCIPPRKNRKIQYHYNKDLYRQRHPPRPHLHVRHRNRRYRLLLVVINEA